MVTPPAEWISNRRGVPGSTTWGTDSNASGPAEIVVATGDEEDCLVDELQSTRQDRPRTADRTVQERHLWSDPSRRTAHPHGSSTIAEEEAVRRYSARTTSTAQEPTPSGSITSATAQALVPASAPPAINARKTTASSRYSTFSRSICSAARRATLGASGRAFAGRVTTSVMSSSPASSLRSMPHERSVRRTASTSSAAFEGPHASRTAHARSNTTPWTHRGWRSRRPALSRLPACRPPATATLYVRNSRGVLDVRCRFGR